VSRITKIVAAVLATVLVAVGAIVVYRETDLLTGSLVVLAALMIVGLLARRVAVREEKEGMAEWEHESRASAAAAEDLFGDWKMSSPRAERTPSTPAPMSPSPTVAPPVPGAAGRPAAPLPADAEVPEPVDPSVAVSRPIRTSDERSGSTARSNDSFGDVDPTAPAPVDRTPNRTEARTPAYAGSAPASTTAESRFLIDWTGQGRPVDEQVRTSDDIMRASEVTALPAAAAADPGAGTELARLLAKVEARLRDYD
jgi:hypothetical protein